MKNRILENNINSGDFFYLNRDIIIRKAYENYVIWVSGEAWVVDETYINFIRSLPCRINGKENDIIKNLLDNKIISKTTSEAKIRDMDVSLHFLEKYGKDEFSWFEYTPCDIDIDVTQACNFACIHCARDAGDKLADELTTAEIKNIIDQTSEMNAISFTFMGGEPLVRKDIEELVRYASNKFPMVIMGTNGWLVENNINWIKESLNMVQVSLHGSSAKAHDSFVGKEGAFEKAIKAIKILKENNVQVTIAHTITNVNIEEYVKVAKIALEMNVSIRFVRLCSSGRGKNLDELSWNQVVEIEKKLKEFNSDLIEGGGFDICSKPKNKSWYGCPAGRTLMCITANGFVNGCAGIKEYVGNSRNNSLLDLWHSPKFIESRKKNIGCDDCKKVDVCAGPCRLEVRHYERYNRETGVDFCNNDNITCH